MRRNQDLIRNLVLFIEEHGPIDNSADITDLDGLYTKEEIEAHLEMLFRDGWVTGIDASAGSDKYITLLDLDLSAAGRQSAERIRKSTYTDKVVEETHKGHRQQLLLNPNTGTNIPASSIVSAQLPNFRGFTQKVVLGVFSSPNDLHFLSRLEAERKRFEDVLSFNPEYIYFSISPRKEALVRELNSKPPYLFHYSGHAHLVGIALQKEESGESEFILWQGLGQMLARFRDTLQVVVLNGCQTVAPDFFKALGNNRPTVIATTGDILDKDAAQFTRIFYEYLAKGRTPQQAFEIAIDTFMLTDIIAAERFRFFAPNEPISD